MSYPPTDPVFIIMRVLYGNIVAGEPQIRAHIEEALRQVSLAGWRIIPTRNLDEGEILGEWTPA